MPHCLLKIGVPLPGITESAITNSTSYGVVYTMYAAAAVAVTDVARDALGQPHYRYPHNGASKTCVVN
jgi:hypothetical protein